MVSSVLLGFVGWYYIPNIVTKYALGFLHQFYANIFHIPPPQPGTLSYQRHYRCTYATVVLGYLLYNLVQGASSMPANFYEIMGVPSDVDESGLKTAFRQFAKRNHPDRAGPLADEMFMAVRDVYDALKNPVVRFAYDRFGPDVLSWTNLSTPSEYLRHGLIHSSGYHVASGVFLLIWSSIGRQSPVKFWRYLLYLTLFVSELSLLIYSTPPSSSSVLASGSLLHAIFPHRVAFQHVLFLHQLFMFLTTALTNVAPVLFPNDQLPENDILLQKLNALAGTADREASLLLHTELHSIHPSTSERRVATPQMRPYLEPSSEVMDQLAVEMENMIIERQIMLEEVGPLKSACEAAVEKGRKNLILSNDHSGSGTLPSPVSPSGSPPRELNSEKADHDGVLDRQTRLPSPRPSPPPSLQRKGSSYVRARSISY